MNKETKQHFIDKMKPHVNKLIASLSKEGIVFIDHDEDPNLENVSFKQGDKELKIAHSCFYRHSGIALVYKENETISLTDDMYINTYMKSLILLYFNNHE